MSDDVSPATGSTRSGSPMPVPPLLNDLAGWMWRLLVLALGVYLTFRFLNILEFVALPFFAALFAATLGYPVVRLLRDRLALSRLVATWITALLALIVLGGVAIFVVDRAIDEYPALVTQVQSSVTHFRDFLTNDLHVKSSSTASINTTINRYLEAHSSSVASSAVTGITTIAEGLAEVVLWFFITFFLLYDGDTIWSWIVALFPEPARDRVIGAGGQAWNRLAGFVRGTFVIAVFHAVVAAVTLSILQVPLVAPLTLLIFFGSFLPIVGSITMGSLAVAVTLVTRGHVEAIILAAVLVADNQVEAHLLQPLMVGRYVRLHPLAVALSIAAGGVLEGIPGAVLAVPFVAVVYAVAKYLATGETDADLLSPPAPPPPEPPSSQADGPVAPVVPSGG